MFRREGPGVIVETRWRGRGTAPAAVILPPPAPRLGPGAQRRPPSSSRESSITKPSGGLARVDRTPLPLRRARVDSGLCEPRRAPAHRATGRSSSSPDLSATELIRGASGDRWARLSLLRSSSERALVAYDHLKRGGVGAEEVDATRKGHRSLPLPLSLGLPALFFFLHSLIPASSVANWRALVTIGLNGVHGHEDVTWQRDISLCLWRERKPRARQEKRAARRPASSNFVVGTLPASAF